MADDWNPPPLEVLNEDWQRALAIVAHPDDLEYGAASAIARWTDQGKTVVYSLVTSGEAGIDGMDPARPARCASAEEVAGAAVVGVRRGGVPRRRRRHARVRPAAAPRRSPPRSAGTGRTW